MTLQYVIGLCVCVPVCSSAPNSGAFVLLPQADPIDLLQDSDGQERSGSGLCAPPFYSNSSATAVH